MVTIKDVAKLAGVSVSTASNALNGKYGVNEKTRQRVLKAAQELNYKPNPMAKGLVTNSTRNVGIIITGPSSFNVFTNPIFIEIIREMTVSLSRKGYHAMLNVIDLEEEEEYLPRIAQSRTVDVLIYLGTRKPDKELVQLIRRVELPFIVVLRDAPDENTVAVSVNNRKCGYDATRYLIEMGHRRIGFIGVLPGVKLAEERFKGYRQALEEAGIPFDPSLVVEGNFYQESGAMGVRRLLRQASQRPTAIFCANDMMALGAIEGLGQEGLPVPDSISLIGCDNIPNLHLMKVPLTTVAHPISELGRLSVEKAVGILEGNDKLPDRIILESEIRVRGSVRRLNESEN